MLIFDTLGTTRSCSPAPSNGKGMTSKSKFFSFSRGCNKQMLNFPFAGLCSSCPLTWKKLSTGSTPRHSAKSPALPRCTFRLLLRQTIWPRACAAVVWLRFSSSLLSLLASSGRLGVCFSSLWCFITSSCTSLPTKSCTRETFRPNFRPRPPVYTVGELCAPTLGILVVSKLEALQRRCTQRELLGARLWVHAQKLRIVFLFRQILVESVYIAGSRVAGLNVTIKY